jgi:hypothetical protein
MYKTPNVSRRVAIILGITLLFMAALGAFLFWYLGGQEKAATTQAKEFISALVKNDPAAAPKNGDDYVRGVWAAYRRVDSAKLIDTHQRSSKHTSSNSGYSWWVADMLLHTGRGLAVLELKFEPNHLDPKDQIIDLLYELTPDRIPSGALDAATLARVKSDQRERGPKPEDGITLDVNARSTSPSAPSRARDRARPYRQPPIIRCVQRAHGDVAKIQKCSRLAGK